jgi:hypothetical protein
MHQVNSTCLLRLLRDSKIIFQSTHLHSQSAPRPKDLIRHQKRDRAWYFLGYL